MANVTTGRGACAAPFLQLSNFPSTVGYIPGRFCAPVPTLEGTIDCCLPCPITDWVYSDEFDVVPKAANWLNVAGMACTLLLLLTFLVLPVQTTSRHYLTVSLVIAVCLLQLGFIIPIGIQPEQCHDAITPNDMQSELTCAFSGAFLLFGGFAVIIWGFLRSVSIHLQICWQVVPGKKFFWSSIVAGWGLPGMVLAVALPLTGTSYRFGSTCHINHQKALQDYWGPLLAFAGASTILQFATFGYCIKVYVTSLFKDGSDESNSQVGSSGLPSYNSRAGSVKTVTAGQTYRRVKEVIALQWRGTVIALIIIVTVAFLAVIFVQMDNTVTAAVQNLGRAQPWLLCLVLNEGDKSACLDQVKAAGLVTNEATVMAVLLFLSLNGIWTLLFLGRTSMILGWVDLIRRRFGKPKTDFVSVDARRFSNNPKTYELITSPPPSGMPKTPETVITSPTFKDDGLSPLAQSPPSSSNQHTTDYFGKETYSSNHAHPYSSPLLSFSTPRLPSAGRGFARDPFASIPFSASRETPILPFSQANPPARSFSQASEKSSVSQSKTPAIEWDPVATHAPSTRTPEPHGEISKSLTTFTNAISSDIPILQA